MRLSTSCLLLLATLGCPLAAAQERDPAQWWGVANVASHHFNAGEDFNEFNPGVGIEVQWQPRHGVAAGYFRNSVDHDSFYALYQYTPLALGRHVRVGAMIGAVTGYPGYNDGGIAPGGGLVLKAEIERFGANLVYLPKLSGVTPNTLGLQVKYRFR